MLFTNTDICTKNCVLACIMSIRKPQCKDQAAIKSLDEIVGFVSTNEKILSGFGSVCVRAINSNEQHTKHMYLRLPGCRAVHDPREKQTELEIERLVLNEMEETYNKLSKIKCDGE